MILFKTGESLRNHLQKIRKKGASIGFVPTMGALHQGHISLISRSRSENSHTVCSIFVNPTQFNNAEDFAKYPITVSSDIDKLEAGGCDILFLPSVEEIYPPGHEKKQYDLGFLETVLEGSFRPGHFQGVCEVVDRLLGMVEPHVLYLGRKDYQQCMVLSKLLEITKSPTRIVICDTMRETDGLAMSSRNARLSEQERIQAVEIYKTLQYLKANLQPGPLAFLKETAANHLREKGFLVDYVDIADARNLNLIDHWNGYTPLVGLIAAFLNKVRLIDNDSIFSID